MQSISVNPKSCTNRHVTRLQAITRSQERRNRQSIANPNKLSNITVYDVVRTAKAIHARVYTQGHNRLQNVCKQLYNGLHCKNTKPASNERTGDRNNYNS